MITILGSYEGTCLNQTCKPPVEAGIVLILRKMEGQEVIGDISIHGDLGGSSPFSGVISGSRITFVTRSLNGKLSITWSGTIANGVIEGSYAVIDERWFMGIIGMRNQHGLWKCEKSES